MNAQVKRESAPARVVPWDPEIEQALLGAILVNNDAYDRVSDILRAEHFLEQLHQRIYEVIGTVIKSGRTASPNSLRPYFELDAGIQDVGGPEYLMKIAASTPAIMYALEFAQLIIDHHVRRNMVAIADEITAAAIDPPPSWKPEDHINEAERRLFIVSGGELTSSKVELASSVAARAIARAEAAYRDPKKVGVSMGLEALDIVAGGLFPGDLVVLGGATSMGKAQPIGSLVLTPTGFRKIGDLKVGDEVSSVDGKASRIVGVFPQGVKPVFRVAFSDGRSTTACGEHLWRAHQWRWGPSGRVVDTATLRKKVGFRTNKGRVSVPLADAWDRAPVDLPLDPYVLGALLGDGCLRSGTPQISSADGQLLALIADRLKGIAELRFDSGYDWRIVGSTPKHQRGVSGVRANPITKILAELQIHGHRSHTKFVPPVYLNASREQRLELLRGLLDTDGMVERETGSVWFGSSSQQLALDVQWLVRSLGGLAHITKRRAHYSYNGERRTGLVTFRVNVRHPNPKSLFLLDRKRERAPDRYRYVDNLRLSIKAITSAGTAECVCIAVSHPSKLYVTDDFIVTHNTALAQQIGWNVANGIVGRDMAEAEQRRVMVSTAEMSDEQYVNRHIAQIAGVPTDRIESGRVSHEEITRIIEAGDRFNQLPLFIDATRKPTVGQIRTRARRVIRKHGPLALLIVDHLRFVQGDDRRAKEMDQAQQITTDLRSVAAELGCAVLLISHFNRDNWGRTNRRPILSDLYGASAIEQNADVILFVYRESYYLKFDEPDQSDEKAFAAWHARKVACEGKAEIICAKRRRGRTGTAHTLFDEEMTRFSDLPSTKQAEQRALL